MHTGLKWKRWTNKSQRSWAPFKTWRAKVGFSAWTLLGLRQTFVGELPEKKAVLDCHMVALRRENRLMVHENPVAGRARQVVAIRSAVSVWNCPCTKKRSLEAGGRHWRWSLKPGFYCISHGHSSGRFQNRYNKENIQTPSGWKSFIWGIFLHQENFYKCYKKHIMSDCLCKGVKKRSYRPFAQWRHAAYQNTLPDHSWIKLYVNIQVDWSGGPLLK